MSSSIYNLLNINRKSAHAAYEKLRLLKGLWCDIYYPTSEGSIFGLEDLVDHDPLAKKRKQLLVFGLFQEAEAGMEGYDSFIESYILTTWEERLPQQTMVVVDFCNRSFSFKVDTHRNLSPSTRDQLFIKNVLVAAT